MNSCFGNFPHSLFSVPSSSTSTFVAEDEFSIIQDLDLYFVRQIAHSLQECDLEQKINLETKMKEGTTKLLAACKHAAQSLEAAKSLLVSNERMSAYVSELQQRKAGERRNCDMRSLAELNESKAKVAVSDIRIPLIWKDTDHFKNKGDYRRFAVFCLLKVGSEIFDTAIVNNIDRTITDIPFEDAIVFSNVTPGFELRLEVYSHILHNDLSIASTPRKLKKRISNSISRTIGKKLAANLKEELSSTEVGPKFELVAHATLKLEDSSDDIHTHDLVSVNMENPHNQLPLFGHFCCRLAVQPECIVEERFSGYLKILQIGNVRHSLHIWCVLKGIFLSAWSKQEDTDHSPPVFSILVNKNSKLKTDLSSSECHRSFKIINIVSGKTVEHVLAADNEYELDRWISCLKQHIQDQVLWGHATDQVMDIPSPETSRTPMFMRSRQGSLYEETRYIEPFPSSLSASSSLCLHSPSIYSRSSSSSAASSAGSSHLAF